MIFKQQIEGVIFDIELEGYLKCQPGIDVRRVRTFQAKKKKGKNNNNKKNPTEYSLLRGSGKFYFSACPCYVHEIWGRGHGGVRLPSLHMGKLRRRGCQCSQHRMTKHPVPHPNMHFTWNVPLLSQDP